MTALPPTGLLCELLAYPARTEIAAPAPRFSWVVKDTDAGVMQSAYQILVASSLALLADNTGDLWDSGVVDFGTLWVTSSRSLHVPYDGAELASHSTYYWKVRTWNRPGAVSPYSEPQAFRTGELSPQPTTAHYPVEQRRIAPVRVAQLDRQRYFLDFGKAAFATLEVRLTSREPCTVTVAIGEVLAGPLALETQPGGNRRYYATTLDVKPGTHTYTLALPPHPYSGNAVRMPEHIGEVLPFRYAELDGVPGALTRDDVCQLAASYPFNDAAAQFTSSDGVLNDVWELCRYTMQATSFCGIYVDGDRERIPYEADAYINQLGHYCCDREFTMARATIAFLLEHATWPTEWQLFMPLMVWADYQQTGDPTLIERHYDALCAKSLIDLAREDGLISVSSGLVTPELLDALHLAVPLRDIIDWPLPERDGYEIGDVNTVVNALHAEAVREMAEMADLLGKPDDAARFRAQAARVRESMLRLLFDAETGLFVDSEASRHSSLHANAFPLCFEIVPATHRARIVNFLREKGMACSVYAAQFLVEGLYRAGAGDAALALLTARGERSWAHMIDVGSTIALEAWDDRFKPNQDWNHAWGAAPANLIPRWLLGIRPLEPGFGKILIHPQPGTLPYAAMTLPTIRGDVTVRLENHPGRSLYLEVEIPANTQARVVLPALGSANPTVLVDGIPTQGLPGDETVTIDALPSGRHTLYRGGVA